jgi:ABC-type phosphate/phosphonate transport system substrate-binding protein
MRLAFSLALLLALALPGHASGKKKKVDISVVITAESSPWVEPSTVLAASRPLFEMLARRARLTYSMQAFTSEASALDLFLSGKTNAGNTSLPLYMKLSEQVEIVPLCRPVKFGRPTFRLLLLVRAGSQIEGISGLRGKAISIDSEQTSRIYLTVLARRSGIKDTRAFFRSIQAKRNPRSAVLDVLMGEADACIVSDVILRTMAELNPKLARRVVQVHASEPFAYNPVFVRKDLPARKRAALKKVSLELHDHTVGKQVLTIFRIDRMVAARPDYESFRKVWREYARLKEGK